MNNKDSRVQMSRWLMSWEITVWQRVFAEGLSENKENVRGKGYK